MTLPGDDERWAEKEGPEGAERGDGAGGGGSGDVKGGFRSTEDMENPDVEEFVGEDGVLLRRRRVRKRKRKTPEIESVEWERRPVQHGRLRWVLVVGAGLVVLVVAGLMASLLLDVPGGGRSVPAQKRRAPVLVKPDRDGRGEVATEGLVNQDLPMRELEAVARRFFAAENVEEMSRWVRNRERVLPLMKGYYARPGHEFRPEVCRTIGEDEGAFVEGAMAAILVTLGDFSQRQIALQKTEDGFLVDWESWVGYSEMSWEEFKQRKPTRPLVFRVRMRRETYFNFGFSDDSKWLCFRMLSPEGDLLWGYAAEDTASAKLVTWDTGDREELATVLLRFPENASRADQAVIDDFVVSGWVVHDVP